jgi:transposase-like protein
MAFVQNDHMIQQNLGGSFPPALGNSILPRTHGLNPNLVFNWRRLYQKGRSLTVGSCKSAGIYVKPLYTAGCTIVAQIAPNRAILPNFRCNFPNVSC